MRGKGVMRGFSLPRSSPMKKTLKRCNLKEKLESAVVIDVDGDGFENVITIDSPEHGEEEFQSSNGSKRSKQFVPSVISIDDDESEDVEDPEICVECGELDSDASSSKSCPAPNFMQKSAGLDDDECQFIREKKSAFKLSKCKKTYTGKTSCGKRFGISPESEDSLSESDCSDCELMEGSFGKLREEWEKAFQRKKYNIRNGQSGLEDQSSASVLHNDAPKGAEEEYSNQECAETPASSGSSDSHIRKQKASGFETNEDYCSVRTCGDHGTESPFVESDKRVDHENFSQPEYGPTAEAQFSHVHADFVYEREIFKNACPSRDGDRVFSWKPSNSCRYPSDLRDGKMDPTAKQNQPSVEPMTSVPEVSEERKVDVGVSPSACKVGTFFDENSSDKTPFGGMPVASSKNYCDGEKVVVSGESSQNDGTQMKSFTGAGQSSINSVANSNKYDEGDTFHVVDATAIGNTDIFIDREKLKETDEFKRAAEEEWASRQRELQFQAEEAQRLRKRKKAESMRLLDMERRQKQRLEEIRETQKKDEENMNLKEQLRHEVRKELIILEKSCIDMASLLRSLGIPVAGGVHPLSSAVHAAYKRALLRFHPDRASKTDIRKQVEAEEKFKLISRMKEKFLATPCH